MFPALETEVYGKPLVYLDNAATSQRPLCVVEKERTLSIRSNANIHRAVHRLAVDATEEFEKTRQGVRAFLNAESEKEIVFTSGTTMSVNLVASCFGEAFMGEGDEVIVSAAEHHSNIVPWQLLCARKKAVLKVLEIDEFGGLMVSSLEKLISQRTKIVAISHISNVLGLVNPVSEIARIAHAHGVPVLVDGAQGCVHEKVDVQELDCDFYAFSGHKVYGATGTGVLYGKKKWLEAMPPYMGGGEMIETVRFSGTTYAPVPGKFEAGTQNFNAIPTMGGTLGGSNEDDLGGVAFVIVIVLIFFVIISMRKKRENSAPVIINSREPVKTLKPMEEYLELDPDFDEERIKDLMSNLYVQMQETWHAKDISPLRPYMTDKFYNQMEKSLEELKKSRRTDYTERIAVLSVDLRGWRQAGGRDYITVGLNSRIISYVLDDMTGELISGHKDREKFMEYELELTRKSGEITKPEEEGAKTDRCPHCGAPLKLNASAKCEYCGSVITNVNTDWAISSMRGISQRTA